MYFTLNYVLSVIDNIPVTGRLNANKAISYVDVDVIEGQGAPLKPRTLYLCRSSQLPLLLPELDIGLMVIDDCSYDFSGCSVDTVLLADSTDLSKLKVDIENKLFRYSDMAVAAEKMLSKLTDAWTIKEVVDYCYEFLGNPVLMYNKDSKLLYFTAESNALDQQIMDTWHINLTPAKLSEIVQMNTISLINTGVSGIDLQSYGAYTPRRMIAKMMSGNQYVGGLVLMENEKEFGPDDPMYLKIFSRIIAQKAASSWPSKDISDLLFEQRFADVLNGRFNEINAGIGWLHMIGGNKFQNFRIAALDIIGLNSHLLEKIDIKLRQSLYFCRAIQFESYLVLLCNPKDTTEYASLKELLDELTASFGISAGLSSIFTSISDARTHLSQATKALETGRMLGWRNKLFEFDVMKVYVLLHELAQALDLECYRNTRLEKLEKIDEETGSEYYKTLLIFLASGGSKHKTSDAMKIHRNTLAYRLEKIEAVLGRSLDEGEFLFWTWLSTKVKEILEAKEK